MFGDYIMSLAGIMVFDIIRFHYFPVEVETRTLAEFLFYDPHIVLGLIVFPLMMLAFYAISGYYNDVRAKSRLDDIRNSWVVGFVGMLFVYFLILINDYQPRRVHNYELLGILWACLSGPVMLFRMVVTAVQRRRLRAGNGIYTAVIIGEGSRAAQLKRRVATSSGGIAQFNIIDVIPPTLDSADLVVRIEGLAPDAILLAPHPDGIQATTELINMLFPLGHSVFITPDLYQLITSRARVTDVVGEPLINISEPRISPFTTNLKRIADILVATTAMLVLMPVYVIVAIAVKLDSKGPVLYKQERIGFHKRPFKIVKFRTMRPNAEPDGPALSVENDPRVTRVGHILRRYRLDEIPQFWNVIRGDMSLVGPRPERRHFIDQIVERVPHYSLIHQVRPGITSWGAVKYGYASSVDEMVDRLYYDLLYIENVSFSIDLKIIFHTVSTVIMGRGL